MLANFHTHTTYCDGESAPEDIVLSALKKGFDALGFSGHAYTDFDLSYCMKNIEAYVEEINRLKEKYKKEIQIYAGVEEDIYAPVNRADFDYIISSSHYVKQNGKYLTIDHSYDILKKGIEAFNGDVLKYAENYYMAFSEYILKRKPDIVGHFDLLTKFDELDEPCFMNNRKYLDIAEKYLKKAIESECVFEVNTGAVSRGYRSSPYPQTELLHILKKHDCKIMITSDSHSKDTLDFYFDETKELLKDIGFKYTYLIYDNDFIKSDL